MTTGQFSSSLLSPQLFSWLQISEPRRKQFPLVQWNLHSAQSGEGRVWGQVQREKTFFFLSTTISNVWFSEKSCVHSLNNRLEANIISDAPLCNFRGQNVLFIQGLQVFVAFKE